MDWERRGLIGRGGCGLGEEGVDWERWVWSGREELEEGMNIDILMGFNKMTTWAERTLVRISQDLLVFQDGRDIQLDSIDSLRFQLELVLRDLFMQVKQTNKNFTCMITITILKGNH